ncbi:MAG TPA: sulfatase [Pirellulales bacterium]|nr:sulfatase [Pirellulales bacterium]
MKRTSSNFLAGVAACLLAPLAAGAASPDKPNFIVINVDDLGYADIGPFGSNLNRTPNLDRMAAEGRKLTCFYAAPVCSPSRSALMTGCYPKRVLPIPSVLFPAAAVGLNPAERTIAELLRDAGYKTACVGKWHLGDQPEFLPTRQGFDEYLGIPYSNDMGPAAEGSKSSLGDPLPQRKPKAAKDAASADAEADETGIRGAQQPPLPLLENEKVIDRVGPEEQQGIVERYTGAAVKFIRAQQGAPFFLYLPHSAVHFPLYPGKAFQQRSHNGLYGDWVEEVDASVGRILDVVRELKLAGRTLVLFTSDNGGTPRSVNAPLHGFKGSTWEGGMRVPTVVWWPGKIPAKTSTDEVTGMFDVLPTLVKLAGGTLPADRRLDGADVWPLLSGAAGAKSPHEVFYYFRGLKLEAVRSGKWKLHLGKNELYDLEADLAEASSVAAKHADVVRQLERLAKKMDDDLGTSTIGPGCRPLGRVASPQPLIDFDGKIRAGFSP